MVSSHRKHCSPWDIYFGHAKALQTAKFTGKRDAQNFLSSIWKWVCSQQFWFCLHLLQTLLSHFLVSISSELMKRKACGCCSKLVFKSCMKWLPFCLVQRLCCAMWGRFGARLWGPMEWVNKHWVQQEAWGRRALWLCGLTSASSVSSWCCCHIYRK